MRQRKALEKLRSLWISALLVTAVIGGGEVRANGLRLGLRIQEEMSAPLVPVQKNFRPCFKRGADGIAVLSLCPANDAPRRLPAAQKKKTRPRPRSSRSR